MKRRSDHRSTNKSTRDATMDEFYGFKQFNQQPPTLSSSSTHNNHNNNNNNNKNTKTRRTNIVGSREYFDEAAKWMEQHEQQQQQHENHRDASSKRISDRETHYQSRWRKRELSPDRIDPFSTTTTTTTTTSSSSSNKRSYSEIYQESALDREKADLENQLKRKQMNKQLLSAAKAHATSSTTATATHTHNPNDDSTSEVTSQHKQRNTSSLPSLRPQSSTTTINHNDDNNNNTDNTDNNTNVHINYKPSGLLYNYQQQQTSTGGGSGGGNVEEEEARNNMMTSSWNDPPESRIPTGQKWRLYVMRDGNEIEKPIHLIHQKSFLFGRDRNTVDVPIDHLSCSKLHAVICFRLCSSSTTTTSHKRHQKKSREDSEQQSVIKPFLMDMKSTNGTMLNGKRVEDCRFYELRNNDLIQFGHSTREYILIDERLALEEEE